MKNLKRQAKELQSKGRDGDTVLAHISPEEGLILKAMGGAGTTNPDTGLPEFSFWTSIRDAFQAVVSVVANYYLPGSSLITSQLVSKGAQEHLQSDVGRLATVASGVAGGVEGNLSNWGKAAQSITGGNALTDAQTWVKGALDKATDFIGMGSAAADAGTAVQANVSNFLTSSAEALPEQLAGPGFEAAGAAPVADGATQLAGPASEVLPPLVQSPAVTPPGTVDLSTSFNPANTGTATPAPSTTGPTALGGNAPGGDTSFIDRLMTSGKKALTYLENKPEAAIPLALGVAGMAGGMGASAAARQKAALEDKFLREKPEIDRQAAQKAKGTAWSMPSGPQWWDVINMNVKPIQYGPTGQPLPSGQVIAPRVMAGSPGLIDRVLTRG